MIKKALFILLCMTGLAFATNPYKQISVTNVVNVSGSQILVTNTVWIATVPGQGLEVNVTNTPTVDASGSFISVTGRPPVDASGSTMAITNTPDVNVTNKTFNANVTNTPDVNVTNDTFNVNATNKVDVQLKDDNNTPLLVGTNGIGSVLVVEDTGEYNTHQGNHYEVKNYTTIAQGNSGDFLFCVTNKVPRMMYQFIGTGEIDLHVYEDAGVSARGGAIPTHNNNRNSTNTASLLLYGGPIIQHLYCFMVVLL